MTQLSLFTSKGRIQESTPFTAHETPVLGLASELPIVTVLQAGVGLAVGVGVGNSVVTYNLTEGSSADDIYKMLHI